MFPFAFIASRFLDMIRIPAPQNASPEHNNPLIMVMYKKPIIEKTPHPGVQSCPISSYPTVH